MTVCSACGVAHERKNQRYCASCHADYMRKWRKANPLTGESLKRQTARAYARQYLIRGNIEISPCCVCGSSESEMHHPDHNQPLHVYWLCREHHLAWHLQEKDEPHLVFTEWLPAGAKPAQLHFARSE